MRKIILIIVVLFVNIESWSINSSKFPIQLYIYDFCNWSASHSSDKLIFDCKKGKRYKCFLLRDNNDKLVKEVNKVVLKMCHDMKDPDLVNWTDSIVINVTAYRERHFISFVINEFIENKNIY